MISNTLSRNWTLISCVAEVWLAGWLLVSAENGNLTHQLALLPRKSHDPGPFVYVTSSQTCLATNHFLGHQVLLWPLDLVFMPCTALILPSKVVLFDCISQGQAVKILDNIFSETCFKILPRSFTTSVFKSLLLTWIGAGTHIWSSTKNHITVSSTGN